VKLKRRDIGLILGGIMLLSTVAFAFLSASQNNYDTRNDNNQQPQLPQIGTWYGVPIFEQKLASNHSIYYVQIIPNYNIVLRADPRDAENVSSPNSNRVYSVIYTSKDVYALFNPEESGNVSLAFTELSKILNRMPLKVTYGTTKPYISNTTKTYVSKDPYNTAANETVIYLRLANKTDISMVNNTIIVEGRDMWDLTTAATKLQLILLKLL